MDYGKDSTPYQGLPRINIFNQKLISRLILADTIGLKPGFLAQGRYAQLYWILFFNSSALLYLKRSHALSLLTSCARCKTSHIKGKLDMLGAQTSYQEISKNKPAARGLGRRWLLVGTLICKQIMWDPSTHYSFFLFLKHHASTWYVNQSLLIVYVRSHLGTRTTTSESQFL